MQMPSDNSRSVRIALYIAIALLAANLLMPLVRRDGGLIPAAYAQGVPAGQLPIAGGSGLFVMPAQLSGNSWGCYVMDVDRGTLCCYQYLPGNSELKFVAARSFRSDLQLREYNTTPSPKEIANLVEKQNQSLMPP